MANENEIYPVKKLLRITDATAKRISDFRFERRLPSESEAIRQLIDLGLDTAGVPDHAAATADKRGRAK